MFMAPLFQYIFIIDRLDASTYSHCFYFKIYRPISTLQSYFSYFITKTNESGQEWTVLKVDGPVKVNGLESMFCIFGPSS